MKVLFAIGNAAVSEEVKKQYYELYEEKLESKDVFYFKAILEEVKRDKSYDRIVIAEQLEPMQNNIVSTNDQIIFNNIDSITDEIDNSVIIFICSDNRTKSDSLMSRLYNIGIYNILMGDERQPRQLCSLLREPRNKREAKEYLRSNPALGEESVVIPDEGVDERELLNILNYFDRLRTKEEYLNSFAGIVDQYNDEDLMVIVATLTKKLEKRGPEIFEALKEDPRFSKYCGWVDKENTEPDSKAGILGFLKGKKTFSGASNNLKKMIKSHRKDSDINPISEDNKSQVDSNSLSSEGVRLAEIEEQERANQERERVQNDNLIAEQEAAIKAQQEAMMKAQQEAMMKAQQEEMIKAQQEAMMKAQQEAMQNAQQEAMQNAQQEAMQKAQQEAMQKAQQEAMQKAKQEAMQKAQQEAMQKAQQEAMQKAQQEAINNREQEELQSKLNNVISQSSQQNNGFSFQNNDDSFVFDTSTNQSGMQELTQEEILRAQQVESLRKQQEQIQKEREELRARQQELEAGVGGSIFSTNSSPAGNFEEPIKTESQPNTQGASDFDSLQIQKNYKKVVAFIGTNKVGTSFISNSIGTLLAQKGVKVAILDMTKTRGLYWFYGDETLKRRDIVSSCMTNLSNGIASPIHVGKNKGLALYTTIPGGDEDNRKQYKHRSIVDTAKRSSDILIIDCDFTTPYEYLEQAQEIYIVVDFDLVKVQETVQFLKELKSNQIDWSKLRVVVNNAVKSKINAKKIIKGALKYYNDPNMTYTDEFEEIKQYVEFELEPSNFANYIDSMENGNLNVDKYSLLMKRSLNDLVSMIYGNATKKKGLFG